MRLELKPSIGALNVNRAKWFFERGQRTLGRSPDCDWQLPEDQRSVSKLHCMIERDAQGFVLRDQSANGSRVDGVVVHEGETARLSDQSRLEIGDLSFSIHISGEPQQDVEDPDANFAMSDESLTISAILADISPGGRTATGILGSQVSEDWLEPIAKKDGPSPSRNVDIGWAGPPDVRPTTKILPDDWNLEDAGDHSDYGSYLEHGSATHVSLPTSRARRAETQAHVHDGSVELIIASVARPDPASDRPSDLAKTLDPLLRRMENSLEAAFAAFGLDVPGRDLSPDPFGRSHDDPVVERMEVIVSQQAKLQAALESLVHHAGQTMEPRIIESRIDAAAGRLRSLDIIRNRDYWQAYKVQFDNNGRTLSVQDVFRMAMTGANTDWAAPTPAAMPVAEKEDPTDET